MNYGGDAADQIVRYSMEGMEHTLRISGSIAKNLAVLIVAVMKDQKKTRVAVSHLHTHGIKQVSTVQAQTGLILQEVPLRSYIDRKDRFRIADTGNHA